MWFLLRIAPQIEIIIEDKTVFPSSKTNSRFILKQVGNTNRVVLSQGGGRGRWKISWHSYRTQASYLVNVMQIEWSIIEKYIASDNCQRVLPLHFLPTWFCESELWTNTFGRASSLGGRRYLTIQFIQKLHHQVCAKTLSLTRHDDDFWFGTGNRDINRSSHATVSLNKTTVVLLKPPLLSTFSGLFVPNTRPHHCYRWTLMCTEHDKLS